MFDDDDQPAIPRIHGLPGPRWSEENPLPPVTLPNPLRSPEDGAE
ncbi:hypothetical protein [Streptomyces sp. SS]|nr:hypothetical protein [Streptomyces sp. SS]